MIVISIKSSLTVVLIQREIEKVPTIMKVYL